MWNGFLTYNIFQKSKIADNTNEAKVTVLDGILTDVTELVEAGKQKIVRVKAYMSESSFREGSGIVYKQEDGTVYIVTSNFIINDSNEILITLDSGESFEANLIGKDIDSDIAVISFNSNLNVEGFMISKALVKPGEYVLALGAKNFQNIASFGIVNGFNSLIGLDKNEDGLIDWRFNVIQSDVSVNNENNGGPLININGELVGINLNKLTPEYRNIALSVNEMVPIVEKIINQGFVERQYLDINVKDVAGLTTYEKSYFGMNLDITNGVYINEISESSPFYLAGLRANDIIVKYNSEVIKNIVDYNSFIYEIKTGDIVKISYYRNNEIKEVEVSL